MSDHPEIEALTVSLMAEKTWFAARVNRLPDAVVLPSELKPDDPPGALTFLGLPIIWGGHAALVYEVPRAKRSAAAVLAVLAALSAAQPGDGGDAAGALAAGGGEVVRPVRAVRAVLDEHFWHPPVPNTSHPMGNGGCYCGWRCSVALYRSPLAEYRDHLAETLQAECIAELEAQLAAAHRALAACREVAAKRAGRT